MQEYDEPDLQGSLKMYTIDIDMVTKNDDESWSVAEARARFSELLRRARRSPQTILNHGRPVATVIDPSLWEQLQKDARPSLFEASSEIRRIMERERTDLEIPERADRDNPFDEMIDESTG